ncbi:MAG: SDR family oxidoreductase [Burkholderiales bacterium]|nr:SDR family oxidoreductase [Burkholderiales bacterium]
MRDFAGRSVVITGAAGGLGAALVQAFLKTGARVLAMDRDALALERLQQAHPTSDAKSAPRLLTRVCDVTDAAACAAAMAYANQRLGGVDVLVNNAGIAHRSAFAQTRLEVLRRVMDVNFFGAVHCTHAALESLRHRRGLIITISSVAGFAPLIGRTGYAASKHALHGFFDSLRTELEDDGVGVLLVCPSFIDTGIDKAALGGDGGPAAQGRKTTGGQTQPAEVAEAILAAAQRNRRQLLIGSTAHAAWWLSRLWPARYARIMKRRLQAEIFPPNT